MFDKKVFVVVVSRFGVTYNLRVLAHSQDEAKTIVEDLYA